MENKKDNFNETKHFPATSMGVDFYTYKLFLLFVSNESVALTYNYINVNQWMHTRKHHWSGPSRLDQKLHKKHVHHIMLKY